MHTTLASCLAVALPALTLKICDAVSAASKQFMLLIIVLHEVQQRMV